ncbi:hypothetical protein [Flavobacterium sp.]|uniref:hypothetical protein n=1 Tax=Flavobacterium sp. TaxID=239 RepID=UPI002C0AD124|nr:hypothetical protein [Flavobacterium sp.]HSD05679.1 hypothetical protein [Flavobacterium sp.]
MKSNLIYSLIFIFFNLNCCLSQVSKKKVVPIKIHSIIDSTYCNSNTEKYYFEFPDIFNKNEINFFNNSITIDYLNYLDIEKKSIKPRDLIRMAIVIRKKECNDNNNFSGLIGSDYKITFNNSNILSISMDYESLAGNINIDSYYYNFDVPNKKLLVFTDIIKENKTNELLKKCNQILKNRLDELYKENKNELATSEIYQSLIRSSSLFKKENLNTFSIQKNGIEYIFNYGFPNGMFPIDNNIFISYDDLKMILKEDFKKKIDIY